MSLTLTILGRDRLDNGLPAHLQLNERGAIIGRSPTVSWCLPDPSNFVSSRHCEISYRDGGYWLSDTSTNGTAVNGAPLSGPHRLRTGDVVAIGNYQIRAEIAGEAAPSASASAPQSSSGWAGWDNVAPSPTASSGDDWNRPAPQAAISGTGAMSQNWTPPTAKSDADTKNDLWGAPPTVTPSPTSAPAQPASAWGPAPAAAQAAAPVSDPWGSAPQQQPAQAASAWSSEGHGTAPAGDDIWGKIADGYVVDWARGGFGQPATPAPAADPLGLNRTPDLPPAAPSSQAWASSAPVPPPAAQPVSYAVSGNAFSNFIGTLGVDPSALKSSEAQTLETSAILLRRLIAGMVVMLEARARAKAQMGAQTTALSFDGNNPMKFARTPEQALLQLLNPPERGFMPADKAIEDAFLDLQSHQMATLRAMQGALKATLDRFSPNAIRERAEQKGIMAKIFQDSRDAALWKAYEREFSGVVSGSDEAFMDVFSKEFRKAYEELTAKKGF
ncbi:MULTISPECIES: type VI secretion system-associated FHA domain protein TagH [Asticcacaulis]|uniref:type VI secretion system-associated FHA domain protein TagH n=1 Tax=Asticcacaulis TaxID=76890 RepID=UPI001AE9A383|nr:MULTISPECIES: type VI secretion system-associated FHA domain protein TagH [Asticcacaulis]MBP2161039.1 type VI secretion system FHA domain protein [Asticcacaulis solisilvae]MDR6802084.1 type VI secretion system FHA domain protein [Asticcacaulis sp. BE141]